MLQSDTYDTYLRQISIYPLITREEEQDLAAARIAGDKTAVDKLILANLRLVVKVSREFSNYGLDPLDLISEGNLGLQTAAERYAPDRGSKFSTYAVFWIKQKMKRALSDQSRTIRVPVHLGDAKNKLNRIIDNITQEMGQRPDNQTIHDITGVSLKKIEAIQEAHAALTSLDAPAGGPGSVGTEATIGDLIPDTYGESPAVEMMRKAEADLAIECLDGLTPREADVLIHRFGLKGRKEKTLEEIGRHHKVTRERIRQIEGIALHKLKKYYYKKNKENLPD